VIDVEAIVARALEDACAVLALQKELLDLTLHRRVPVVLDSIVGSSWQYLFPWKERGIQGGGELIRKLCVPESNIRQCRGDGEKSTFAISAHRLPSF
jgi:hypothetical protein